MKTQEAIELLRGFQAQIIHGSNTFGAIADVIEALRAAGLDLLLCISPTVLTHKQEEQHNAGYMGMQQGPCSCVVCTRFRLHAEVLNPTGDLAELATRVGGGRGGLVTPGLGAASGCGEGQALREGEREARRNVGFSEAFAASRGSAALPWSERKPRAYGWWLWKAHAEGGIECRPVFEHFGLCTLVGTKHELLAVHLSAVGGWWAGPYESWEAALAAPPPNVPISDGSGGRP